jgi:hypothetical protein
MGLGIENDGWEGDKEVQGLELSEQAKRYACCA